MSPGPGPGPSAGGRVARTVGCFSGAEATIGARNASVMPPSAGDRPARCLPGPVGAAVG